MLSRRRHGIRIVAYFLAELLVVAASFVVAHGIRLRSSPWAGHQIGPLSSFLWLLPPSLFIWGVLLWIVGTYKGFRSRGFLLEGLLAAVTSIGGVLALFAVVAMLERYEVNRSLIGVFGCVSGVGLVLTRTAAKAFVSHYTHKGYDRHYVLIGGTHAEGLWLAEYLEALPGGVFQVRGFVAEDSREADRTLGRWKVLGVLSELPAIASRMPVDEAFLLPTSGPLETHLALVRQCEMMGISVHLQLSAFERMLSRPQLTDVGGADFLSFSTAPKSAMLLALKRAIDVVGAMMVLALVSPLLVLVGLLVKLTSRGPAVFRQERAGMSGRVFTLYKFRTMVDGAEKERDALESRNEMNGPVFKIKDDPRVTGFGRFLRRSSIDELPQLWNVVKGDMSLVGPRPLPVYEVERFEGWQRRRMTMRPGITCLWQVMGRNRVTDFSEWMRLDLDYVDRWSLGLDLKILLKTLPAVVIGRGAY